MSHARPHQLNMAYFVTLQNAKSVVQQDVLKNYELILVPPRKKQQHMLRMMYQ